MSSPESFRGHDWRYGSDRRHRGVPESIDFKVRLSGGREANNKEHNGKMFYVFTPSHLHICDPANGGYPVSSIERGLVRHLEIGVGNGPTTD